MSIRTSIFRLLKRTALWGLKTVAGIVLIYLVVLALGALLLRHYRPQLPEKGLLVIDVERGWVESPVRQSPLLKLLDTGSFLPGIERPNSLLQSIDAVEAAADDPRIPGLVVIGDFSQAKINRIGLSGLLDLGEAIRRFGEKKPTYAYLKNPGLPDLLLAAHCDERFLSPAGDTVFPGIATEVVFFGETFETIGIGVQVAREGTHKSAVEPYTGTGFSPEGREQQQRLTGQLWAAYLDRLTTLSGVERSTFEGWANDQGILRPSDVERSGFARTMPYADFLDKMRDKAGPHDQMPETFSQIPLRRYTAAEKQGAPDRENAKVGEVAVVFVEGIIANEDRDGIADGERIARQIRGVRKSGDYAAIILRVNSPGGAVYPSRIIAAELEKTAATMPVFVSMGQYAASGGYWVSAPGDAIHANPLTLTGSIGVFALIPNVQEAAGKVGLHFERSQSSDMANLFSASEARSPKQMRAIRKMVSNTYGDFLDLVAEHRELPRNEIGEAAEGQVWTGGEALAQGLIDGADGFFALREKLRERLGVDHLRLDLKSHEATPLMTTAFSWVRSRLPFQDLREHGGIFAELLRYRGPISFSPITLSF